MSWFHGVPAAASEVPGTGGHRVLWRRGAVRLLDHGAGDLVLAALGEDQVCTCLLVREAARPSALDRGLHEHAELLERLGGRSPHLATGKEAVVARLAGHRDPSGRRRRALCAAHLLSAALLDRLVLGHLVALERRPRRLGEPGLDLLADRISGAVRVAFGPALRGRARVKVGVADPGEPFDVGLEVSQAGPCVVAVAPLSWLREVWWRGGAVDGGHLVLDRGGRAVRLERRRTGYDLVERVAPAGAGGGSGGRPTRLQGPPRG